jgi:hypothetical protein
MLLQGGALYVQIPMNQVNIVDTVWFGNVAARQGGAIMATEFDSLTDFSISGCTFIKNVAGGSDVPGAIASFAEGGALVLRTMYGSVALHDNLFTRNSARR